MNYVNDYEVVYQTTAFNCMACVAAMVTGDPLEEVADSIGHDGSQRNYTFLEIASYLNRRGYHLGAHARHSRWIWVPSEQPALLIVKQTLCPEHSHSILWDGEKTVDPERRNSHAVLADYKILEWWPIHYYKEA